MCRFLEVQARMHVVRFFFFFSEVSRDFVFFVFVCPLFLPNELLFLFPRPGMECPKLPPPTQTGSTQVVFCPNDNISQSFTNYKCIFTKCYRISWAPHPFVVNSV